MFSNVWSYVAGKSKTHQREDEELRESHHAKHVERQNRIIEEERARRRQLRKQLKDERSAARNDVENYERKREEKQVELANKRDRLSEAKAKLAKASADLKRLGRQELELVSSRVPRSVADANCR
jgi:septal ring factor EnvC (AmiA/AmiB activator)